MDEILANLREQINEKGELHLGPGQAMALVKWLAQMVVLVREQQRALQTMGIKTEVNLG